MAGNASDLDVPEWYEAVYQTVRGVPAGKVVTYGQAADSVQGYAVTARQVGAAMRFAPSDVPWQRVVGAGGHLPIAKRSPELKLLQRRLLEQEGVLFLAGDTGCVNMAECQWFSETDTNTRSLQRDLFDITE